MSYAVTDAGEADMRKEVSVLDELNEEIDQLASTARDCDTVCPEVKRVLAAAWWFTEQAYREVHGHCSLHSDGFCLCCDHFRKTQPLAMAIKRVL